MDNNSEDPRGSEAERASELRKLALNLDYARTNLLKAMVLVEDLVRFRARTAEIIELAQQHNQALEILVKDLFADFGPNDSFTTMAARVLLVDDIQTVDALNRFLVESSVPLAFSDGVAGIKSILQEVITTSDSDEEVIDFITDTHRRVLEGIIENYDSALVSTAVETTVALRAPNEYMEQLKIQGGVTTTTPSSQFLLGQIGTKQICR